MSGESGPPLSMPRGRSVFRMLVVHALIPVCIVVFVLCMPDPRHYFKEFEGMEFPAVTYAYVRLSDGIRQSIWFGPVAVAILLVLDVLVYSRLRAANLRSVCDTWWVLVPLLETGAFVAIVIVQRRLMGFLRA